MPSLAGSTVVSVMKLFGKRRKEHEIIPKEQQSKEVGVKLMTESKVEDLENMEVPSDAIMGLSVTEFVSQDMQNSPTTRMVPCKADEAKSTTAEFETPRKPAAGIDTRTITRPPKARVQQLPEATVMPLMKNGTGTAAAEVITANTEIKSSAVFSGQPLPSPFATSTPSHTPVQLPQVLGQQSSVPSRPQIPQQTVLPTSVQQNAQITTTKPVPQQTSMPKISSQLQQQQQQPSATGAPIRNVTQPIVVPPSITPFVQGVSTNSSAIVSNTAPQGSSQDVSQREERKLLRARQRTITVQSQVSLDITAAYNEVKQLNSDDPATELVRRVQAIVATREKEWTAKTEKLTQLLAHEQRRNEPLEQKAAERLLAMAEYEKLVQEFVEELKKKNSDEKNNLGESKSVGRPGPERNLSPDDVTQLIKERDQLAEEVNSLETSYSELFRRYEKLRQTSVEIKRNEESVKNASEEMARRYAILAEKFEMLRRNAEEQLDLANNEIERLIKQHEADTLGLRLKVKHQESKIDSLTVSLEARQKELESMTAIFEEVITKAEANDAEVDAS
uniref:Transforming acidic coiled-coil-containing protein C-terminal domain-containing protein n=1 Tax=Setaria digitata TaxID=48799 RepID=A0A915PFP8_9BILA